MEPIHSYSLIKVKETGLYDFRLKGVVGPTPYKLLGFK